MIVTKHLKTRMAQRGYNVHMLDYVLSCASLDQERARYFLGKYNKEDLINELHDKQNDLRILLQRKARLKKRRERLISSCGGIA